MESKQTQQSHAAVQWNLMVDATTAMVTRLLHEAGIRSMLLRGPVIARRIYANGTPRPYRDCDLLVGADNLAPAETVLANQGYIAEPADSRLPDWQQHAHSWLAPQSGVRVELHWRLMHVADSRALWEAFNRDPGQMRIGGMLVAVPRDPELGLIVALHAAQHGVDWGRPQADLSRALEILTPAAWGQAASLAREVGAADAFAAGLALSPVGRDLAIRLGLEENRTFQVSLTSDRSAAGALELERFIRASSVRTKTRMAAQAALPSPAQMRQTRPIAARGILGLAAAYAWQPVHIAIQLRSSIRIRRSLRRRAPRPPNR